MVENKRCSSGDDYICHMFKKCKVQNSLTVFTVHRMAVYIYRYYKITTSSMIFYDWSLKLSLSACLNQKMSVPDPCQLPVPLVNYSQIFGPRGRDRLKLFNLPPSRTQGLSIPVQLPIGTCILERGTTSSPPLKYRASLSVHSCHDAKAGGSPSRYLGPAGPSERVF